MRSYRDSAGWVLAYPRTLHLEHSRSPDSVRNKRDEVTVASFPMRSRIYGPPHTPQGGFPSDGVAFRVFTQQGDIEFGLQPESHFPLRLSSFHRSTYPSGKPPALERTVIADTGSYTVEAWIGTNASARERAMLDQIVASLAFPRLHAGQTLGNFGVFAEATHYPVGSVTRVGVQGEPFYLVHAPGGWYAIAWKGDAYGRGYRSRCRLRFDRATTEFFCTNIRARWDRVGQVIVRPGSARQGEPLDLNDARPAWDGHVLVDPSGSPGLGMSYLHQLWPSVYP